ncbi:trifunctional transcriptional regulator/proline dehydrogenase/L-glutamate gamma-semialdehyde dehydrogenase [Acetobacteraceae bacterium H6797]|nr:trifunctional transcriptional regulator/proline dehydrogenase/L-glutamate gamma-semialdehyde dehydrogenase [Acetobacteraceae bacterium H6797]
MSQPAPFAPLAAEIAPLSPLRRRIADACRRPEPDCIAELIDAATLPPDLAAKAEGTARRLVEALRAKPARGGVEELVREFALSSQEGVALMCLAEALLRIPDAATRDALIRDKISDGDWRAHLGQSRSIFVNAATWGLVVTGKLTGSANETGLSGALTRLIARSGEPVIRKGVELAMRMMGEQFVTGQTIEEALRRARKEEAKGFRYSYDMLGEAAMTAEDAARYLRDYETAIHAIGKASAGRGIHAGPGISIKLSALHPRYSRAQKARVMGELLPRVAGLCALAKRYDIGLNIDAEEADRLELSLDLLEALRLDPAFQGWNGLGFVVQAYGRRCPFVLDYIIDLARRSGHRIMVRLVKGAYWDSEIKRAQIDGLSDFPVYTRKIHTDVSYLACARKLLAARDVIFPQFATHNAQTLASIHALAGEGFQEGDYEFQCLHGMGEPLYEEVVPAGKLARPCRIYAPVGTHETLLAYLVRRLLENGANASFVHRIGDAAVPVSELVRAPADQARAITPLGAPHPALAAPRALFGAERENSAGVDLASEPQLASLAAAMQASASGRHHAAPLLAWPVPEGPALPVLNPADTREAVGTVAEATPEAIEAALSAATDLVWATTPPKQRAAILFRAAALFEERMPALMALAIREAGKSLPNAVAEVREAVDFLRYYASQAEALPLAARPLGPVVCISPWNFPIAIFSGQVAAALAAGNTVVAKPAEETPLTASLATRLLLEAGVPREALQLLPGQGEVGAALVADHRVEGVMFTGSTEVARLIQKQLATRTGFGGRPVPLIAETGGQNAMIVDSSALAEQVVGDVIASAFDSAGQRCSALRLLCLQSDVAERVLAMLKGAMTELALGKPDRLAVDIGPVITPVAREGILAHIEAMRGKGRAVHALPLPEGSEAGHFVPPTIIEIDSPAALEREVFGPVLHVLRFRRDEMEGLLKRIEATGYGLTFGVHSRLDETIERLTEAAPAGNLYVNRNMIGAVVGVQPFGGHGLSGTGPKAGGPLYLRRLLADAPGGALSGGEAAPAALAWRDWLAGQGMGAASAEATRLIANAPHGLVLDLPGPVGESNRYRLMPRGRVLLVSETEAGLHRGISAALAAGNAVRVIWREALALPPGLPVEFRQAFDASGCAIVLAEAKGEALLPIQAAVAALPGPVLPVLPLDQAFDMLLSEVSLSINTAAAGGNASLMAIG